MSWHALIVDELYEYYDGDSTYYLPPGEYGFNRPDVYFGNHRIVFVDGGPHVLYGSPEGPTYEW